MRSLEGKSIVIFGATSKIGSEVALEAKRRGANVTAFARSLEKLQPLRNAGIQTNTGNVESTDDVHNAINPSADVTINFAAVFNQSANPNSSWGTNVSGEENILRASEKNGTRRHIFISSIAAEIHGPNAYKDTKLVAEKLVKESSVPEWVILRYANVLGTSDKNDLWNNPFISRDIRGKKLGLAKFPFKADARFPFLGLKTAVDATLASISSVPHSTINVLDGYTTMKNYLDRMADVNDVDKYFGVPAGIMTPSIAVLNRLARMSGKYFPISTGAAEIMTNMPQLSTKKMREELGIQPHTFNMVLDQSHKA